MIQTKRLRIRNLRNEDTQDFYVYRSNPEVTKYQGFDVMTLEQCREFIHAQSTKLLTNSGEWIQYGIEDVSTNILIGDCAIHFLKNDLTTAEIGITISHLHHKKGFAKEAMEGILNFLFIEQNARRVVEIVDVENVASIKLLESLNFRKEAHFVENIFFKGKWGSEYQYAILKKEWIPS